MIPYESPALCEDAPWFLAPRFLCLGCASVESCWAFYLLSRILPRSQDYTWMTFVVGLCEYYRGLSISSAKTYATTTIIEVGGEPG